MFLRTHRREKDGKDHTYWSLVETVRTPDGPRQRTLCYLGELNDSAQARWLKTIEVFNQQGETQQLKLFPSHVEPPADGPAHGSAGAFGGVAGSVSAFCADEPPPSSFFLSHPTAHEAAASTTTHVARILIRAIGPR